MRVARCFVLCLLLGLVLVACGDSDPVATFPEKDTLTIMTYNIEDCDKGGTDTSFSVYESITSLVKNEGVDVVCFQEVQPGSATDDLYGDGSKSSDGDVTKLNRAFSQIGWIMPYYGFNTAGSVRRDFVAYWSRYPVDMISSIKPTGGAIDPSTGIVYSSSRPILQYRVKYRGKDIWFYGAHLKSNAGGVIENNAGSRRSQAFHLSRYIMLNRNPEKDLIVILGDMNTMPSDFDNSGNSTIDYLCMKYDNPYNTANDFIPVNLNEIGAVTNSVGDTWGGSTYGTTHPGSANGSGYADATFDHIIVSPTIYNKYYIQGSISIIQKADGFNGGAADHMPVKLTLQFTNNN